MADDAAFYLPIKSYQAVDFPATGIGWFSPGRSVASLIPRAIIVRTSPPRRDSNRSKLDETMTIFTLLKIHWRNRGANVYCNRFRYDIRWIYRLKIAFVELVSHYRCAFFPSTSYIRPTIRFLNIRVDGTGTPVTYISWVNVNTTQCWFNLPIISPIRTSKWFLVYFFFSV